MRNGYVRRVCLLGLIGGALTGRAAPVADDSAFVRQVHRRVTFQFDQRYSLVDAQLVGINGLKLGLEWRGRYRAGAGVYLLSPGIRAVSVDPVLDGANAELRFRYVAVYGEYVLLGNPRWEISAPVQVGYGKYYHEARSAEGQPLRSIRDRVWLLEPTIGGHYRVFRWFGLGAGVGWREAFSVKPQYGNQLDGPIFYGRVKFFLGDLYKVVRGRQRLFTQRGLRRADWGKPATDTSDGGED